MVLISMILSFFAYPFYSLYFTIKGIFERPKPFIDKSMMEDYFYVVTFTMNFGKYITAVIGVLGWVLGTYIMKKYGGTPLMNFFVGFLCFVLSYWFASLFIYFVQSVAYISTSIRKISVRLEKLSRKDIFDDDFTKIVH